MAKKLFGTWASWLTLLTICHWRSPPSPARATLPVPIPPSGSVTARSASPRWVSASRAGGGISAFDARLRHALDDPALREQKHDQHRQNGQGNRGHHHRRIATGEVATQHDEQHIAARKAQTGKGEAGH